MDVGRRVLTGWVARAGRGADRRSPRSAGRGSAYLKPHGALYNRVVDDEDQAAAVLAGSGSLPVLGLPGSAILRLAEAAGRPACARGSRTVATPTEGRLVPRDQPGALVEGADAIAANAVAMAAGGEVQSLCVHGDSPGAVEAAPAVRAALARGRVRRAALGRLDLPGRPG